MGMKKEGKEGGKGEDVMKEVELIFQELDDDGDGAVPVKELHAGLEKAGYHIPIEKIKEVGGDDKEVDKEEFRKLEPELMKAGMKKMKKEGKEGGKGEDVMKEAELIFQELDDDGDGAVPVKELHAGLEKAGYRIPIEKIKEVGG